MCLTTSAYVKMVMHGHTTTARHMRPVATSVLAHVDVSVVFPVMERCVCWRAVRMMTKQASSKCTQKHVKVFELLKEKYC